jgi:hypothetical protein
MRMGDEGGRDERERGREETEMEVSNDFHSASDNTHTSNLKDSCHQTPHTTTPSPWTHDKIQWWVSTISDR